MFKIEKIQINQFIIGIIAGIIIIMCGCIEDNKPKNILSNATIVPIEKIADISLHYDVFEPEIKKNSEISFKVGDRFVYQSPGYKQKQKKGTESQHIFTVERIEKVDGRDTYVVVSKLEEITAVTLFDKTKYYHASTTTTYYYDKITGKVLKVLNEKQEVIKDGAEELRATDLSFFAYWMLGLTDDARWEMLFTQVDSFLNTTTYGKFEFRVVGREKVNDRECFKVEKRSMDIDDNRVREIGYFWVDVEKRILIKKEFYVDNVKYLERSLISEL